MAGFPNFAGIRDQLVAFTDATISIADHGLAFGEVLPITSARVRLRRAHFDRLERTTAAIGLSCGDALAEG